MDYNESHISKLQVVSLNVAGFESSSVRIAEDVTEGENLVQELSTHQLKRGKVDMSAMAP
ncbi:MAG: hypothetical protein ACXV5H_10775 [Halobacteriota archaeon]